MWVGFELGVDVTVCWIYVGFVVAFCFVLTLEPSFAVGWPGACFAGFDMVCWKYVGFVAAFCLVLTLKPSFDAGWLGARFTGFIMGRMLVCCYTVQFRAWFLLLHLPNLGFEAWFAVGWLGV
ncbi:hypothetical protein U1Q18_021499 [Sarracenia purpurea var. burkii]